MNVKARLGEEALAERDVRHQVRKAVAETRAIDLGSGKAPKEGFTGFDIDSRHHAPPHVFQCDLADGRPWPIPSASVDRLYSSHCIEHIPSTSVECWKRPNEDQLSLPFYERDALVRIGRLDAFCWFMEEAWRVAAPGATFDLHWPAMNLAGDSLSFSTALHLGAFLDPTHRRFIPPQQLAHFSSEGRAYFGVDYGLVCDWRIKEAHQNEWPSGLRENVVLLEKPFALS